jgi:hypothetical protein
MEPAPKACSQIMVAKDSIPTAVSSRDDDRRFSSETFIVFIVTPLVHLSFIKPWLGVDAP